MAVWPQKIRPTDHFLGKRRINGNACSGSDFNRPLTMRPAKSA
jgi:hypothetical protein